MEKIPTGNHSGASQNLSLEAGNVSCHETKRASQPGGISFALNISCLIPLNAFIYPIQEPLVLTLATDVCCGLPRSFCTRSLYFLSELNQMWRFLFEKEFSFYFELVFSPSHYCH